MHVRGELGASGNPAAIGSRVEELLYRNGSGMYHIVGSPP